MKNYDQIGYSPVPNGYEGQLFISMKKSQSVSFQTTSPRVNGKLSLRSNGLEYSRSDRQLRVGSTWSWNNFYASATTINPWIYSPSELQEMFQSEITACNNKWVSKVQAFGTNLIDIYRTRRDTLDMVTSTVRRLTSAYRYIRKRKWSAACETLGISYKKPSRRNRNNPPGAWLEYTYGWSPLCSDVYLLLNQTFPELKIRVATGKDVSKRKRSDTGDGIATVIEEQVQMRMRVVGYVVCNNTALKAASYYGIDNPSLAVWEAMPYSFVVDWFLPIGDYLSSLSAFNGITIRNPSTSIAYTMQFTGYTYVRDATKIYGVLRSHIPAQLSQKEIVYRRSNTQPSYKFPLPENGLSLSRFASALSLMAKAFERKF